MDDRFIQYLEYNKNIHRDVINKIKDYKPYFPFMDIIKEELESLDDKSLKNLLKKYFYTPHIPIIFNYIRTNNYIREEEVLQEELSYEKKRIEAGLAELLFYIFKDKKKNITVIECNEHSSDLKHFLEVLEKRKIKNIKITYIYGYEANDIEIKFEQLNNFKNFLLLEDFFFLVKKYYDLLVKGNNRIPGYNFYELLKMVGESNIYIGEYDSAIVSFTQLLSKARKLNSKKLISEAYYKLSNTHLLKNNPDEAIRFGEQCRDFAIKSEDSVLLAKSAFLLFNLQRYKTAYSAYFNTLYKTLYKKVFEDVSKADFRNYLSFIYTNGSFLISLLKDEYLKKEVDDIFKKGLELSIENNNEYRLSEAYCSEGIIKQAKGYKLEAVDSYKNGIDYKKKIGEVYGISKIAAGLGYYYFSNGDYNNAAIQYNESLYYLKNSKHYQDICGALFNFATLNFFIFNYEYALKYYKTMIYIMDSLNIDDLPYHSRITIYSLIGICLIKLDKYTESIEYVNKIKKSQHYIEGDHEYYELFSGVFETEGEHWELAEKHFEAAYNIQLSKNVDENYFLARVKYEKSLMLKASLSENKAYELWKDILEIIGEYKSTTFKNVIKNLMKGKNIILTPKPYIPEEFDENAIKQLVKLDNSINELHKKIDEISFITNLQDLLMGENRSDTIFKDALTLLTSSFIISSATIIRSSSENNEIIASATDLDIIKQGTVENIETIYFTNLYSVKVISVFESENNRYKLICGNKLSNKIINNDIVKILTIALKQIVAAYEKQKQNELIKQKNKDLLAAEKLAVLGSLVAGLAHELNTPLGMIITSNSHITSELYKMKKEFDNNSLKKSLMESVLTTSLESAELVDLNSRRLNELISSFKQLSIDRAHLDKSSFKLREYINKVLLLLSPILKQKKTKINIICDENIEVFTFPGLFSQIITNLVQNSLIHAFDKPEEGIITIESYIKNNKLVFNYHDNGNGMSPEVTKHIFDPFFTTRRNKGGTGLGMHIVHNIVTQNFQGTINCYTKEGKGSRFYLELPL